VCVERKKPAVTRTSSPDTHPHADAPATMRV
jgi:hypothetical protein